MLSIVTLTYNNLEELRSTLKSIDGLPDTQSVVINGGACARTIEFLKGHPGVVVNEKDNGIADAFSKGLSHSTGDQVIFLNSGDTLEDREYLKKAVYFLDHNPEYSFVHANLIYEDPIAGDIILRPTLSNLGRGMTAQHPTLVANRKIFEKVGTFKSEYRIAMDYEWLVRVIKSGFRGFYFKDLAPVRMNGRGVSNTAEWNGIKECLHALQENDFLNIRHLIGFCIRVSFFFSRKLMLSLGLKNALGRLKRIGR